MRRKNWLLLRGDRQLNWGAILSGAGFLLYIAVTAMGQQRLADVIGLIAGAVSLYVFASVAAERRRDKEGVSLNLFWGQASLVLLNGMCAVLTIREWLGL